VTIARIANLMSLTLACAVGVSDVYGSDVPPAVVQAEQHRVDVISRVAKSTIAVFGVGDSGGGGSAVVISSDGYALTNFHVAKPVGTHLKCGMNDGEFYDAVIVGVDPTGDVAMIKLLGRDDFPAAELGDSDNMRAGDWCIVSGNPFLLATDFHPTVTYGIISGVHRYQYPSGTLLEYADCIQTDAAINPGNSGGPLWDANGRLIGINGRGSFEKRGRVNVGVGYAISINQIKNFMGYLRSGRVVDHATLGATVSTDEDGKTVVTNILGSSDAYRRGLRYLDEVISFGGRQITTTNGFKNTLGIFPKGWRVPLSYRRQGERVDTLVRLEGVHATEELLGKMALGGIAPPKPRQAPEPGRENPEKKPRESELPIPGGRPHRNSKEPEKKLDEKIAKVFTERHGYANYYFNKIERDRVWKQNNQLGEFTGLNGNWFITGKLDDDVPFEITLGERVAGGRINRVLQEVDFDLELQTQLAPRKSGGLLLALHQWRRFLIEGPERFGNVYFLGTAPLYGSVELDGLADVLVGTYDVLESRFYFDPTDGKLIAMELYPDIDVDPCELFFREYTWVDGRQVPFLIDVHFGDERYTTIRVDEWDLGTGGDGGTR
jgi:serine protease Do